METKKKSGAKFIKVFFIIVVFVILGTALTIGTKYVYDNSDHDNNNISGVNVLTATSLVGALTGNAATATALASNPTDCSAGYAPQTIDTGGNFGSCTQYLQSETYVGTVTSIATGNGISGGTITSTGTLTVAGNTALTADADGLSVTTDAIGDTQLAFNTGQHLTTTSNPTHNNMTITDCMTFGSGGKICSG